MIVSKAVKMAQLMAVPILGIVENMSYVECPDCGAHTAYTAFEGDDGRMQAAKTAAQLWHVGKVIGPGVGD